MNIKNIVIVSLVAIALLTAGWLVNDLYNDNTTQTDQSTNQSTVEENTETDQQADTQDSQQDVVNPEENLTTFTSEKGVEIKLLGVESGERLSSPYVLKGEVPGNWSFEADFPVILTNWDGLIIAQEPAQLQGDWMTENYVPFAVTLTFEKSANNNNGSLILQRDNPSGLPSNDDAVEIPIVFD